MKKEKLKCDEKIPCKNCPLFVDSTKQCSAGLVKRRVR